MEVNGKVQASVTYLLQVIVSLRWFCLPQHDLFNGVGSLVGFHTSMSNFTCMHLYILPFQVDFGGIPARLVNFISKRQPLAIAYLRDYLLGDSY